MHGIYRYKNNQPVIWFTRLPSTSNQYCVYCGRFVGKGSNIDSNKEHLIGREFVPTGAFGSGDQFNFIYRTCKQCNDEKANVERHISSVTLFNSPARASSHAHNALAQRKAEKDYHPTKQGTLIKDSGEKFSVSIKLGPVSLSLGISGPPQADPKYLEFLALRQIQGLFTLITSRNPVAEEGTTLLNPKYFHFHGSYGHSDWGNPPLLEIMKRASEIPCYANIETADGFFKAIMRRTEGDSGEWFWALEWNKNLRIVGVIAQPKSNHAIFLDLPPLGWNDLGVQGGARTRIRDEIPLDSELDILFVAEIQNA